MNDDGRRERSLYNLLDRRLVYICAVAAATDDLSLK